MSLDVSRHMWMARVDPKRRHHAVGTYTHVLNQWGIVYDHRCWYRPAKPVPPSRVPCASRSRGSSDWPSILTAMWFAMALAKLLGFDLCPRIYSMRDRHLHVPRGFEVPTAIAYLVQHDVSLAPIRETWDELLRLIATIEQGWRSATAVLERFGSDARGDRIYRAGHALGQLLRTVYLCDYFTLPGFRRSVYQVLERGESVHALQRQICTQVLAPKRGRRAEELIATLRSPDACYQLLDGLEYAATAARGRSRSRAHRTAPRYCIDALKGVGPVGHRHINFRGTFRFPVDRYAPRLVLSAA
jgi:hypothetical protein